MRQARAGHDTRGQRVTPRCRWAAGPGRASRRRAERSSRRGRFAGGPPPTGTHSDQTPLVWRAPEGPEGLPRYQWAAARPRRASRRRAVRSSRRGRLAGVSPPTGTHSDQAPQVWRALEDPWAWLRCPWAGAGPGRTTSRRAERSSRRGRIAGGSPPTGTHSDQAPQVWRAPEGPEGTGGLRDRPLRAVRLACGDLAGGRARRRPEHPWGHKQHSTGARARRPAPLDATTQTRQLRSTCVPSRSARAARRWMRSSRSLRLRRRAGPRR